MRVKKLYFNVKYNFLCVLSEVLFLIDLDVGLLLTQNFFFPQSQSPVQILKILLLFYLASKHISYKVMNIYEVWIFYNVPLSCRFKKNVMKFNF